MTERNIREPGYHGGIVNGPYLHPSPHWMLELVCERDPIGPEMPATAVLERKGRVLTDYSKPPTEAPKGMHWSKSKLTGQWHLNVTIPEVSR